MKSLLNILDKLVFSKYFKWIFTTLLLASLLISFSLKINLSNILGINFFNEYLINFGILTKDGGVVNDLKTHWEYIISLKESLNNLLILTLGDDTNLINYPLHNLIFSQLSFIDSLNTYLITVLIISLFLPYIFYLTLKNHFEVIDKSIIVILSSLILILPAFQFSAIWGNNHNTALIFFSLGIFYFNFFVKDNFKSYKKLVISLIFFSLACYTKQYYSFFFIFLLVYLMNKIDTLKFIFILLFCILCAVPGIYFLTLNPLLFFGMKQNITNFNSAVLINASIILVYLIPFIIQNILNNQDIKKIELFYLFDKKIFLISLFITLICSHNFNYVGNIGGGVFLKLSYILLNNQYLIFPTAFLGIYFLLYFCQKSLSNYTLVILLLTTFNTGYFIFQKYFEPMFYIIFLIFFDKSKINKTIEKNNFVIIFYFCTYYLLTNYMYFLGL